MLGSRLRKGFIAAALVGAFIAPRMAAAQQLTYKVTTAPVHFGGRTTLTTTAPNSHASVAAPLSPSAMANPWLTDRSIPQSQIAALARSIPATKVKVPKLKKPPMLATFSELGFPGIDAYDNYESIGFEIEPPDQALCVGDGYVIEINNSTLAVFSTGHAPLNSESLYTLFGVSSGTTGNRNILSDPRCIYDPTAQQFIVTATYIEANGLASALEIGVLPVKGPSSVYSIDTTNLFGESSCPCFMDEPLLGANGTTVFISSNEFGYSSGSFNQDVVFALSKSDLEAQVSLAPPLTLYGIGYKYKKSFLPAFSIAPANSPGGDFDTDNGGTEFAMASLEGLTGTRNKVALIAVTGTCSFPTNTGTPCSDNVALGAKFVGNKKYLDPIYASLQAAGDYPLGQSLNDPEPELDPGDARIQEVQYTGGKLYSSLATALKVGRNVQNGVLWMSTTPVVKVTNKVYPPISGSSITLYVAKVRGKKFRGGYLGLPGIDLLDPSIAANSSGNAVVAFNMSGASIFPSIGYANVIGGPDRNVHMVVQGVGPEDGFSAYLSGSNGIARWGDYTTILSDSNGNFWFGGEYIGQTCTTTEYNSDNTCGYTRAQYTNWATWIAELSQ